MRNSLTLFVILCLLFPVYSQGQKTNIESLKPASQIAAHHKDGKTFHKLSLFRTMSKMETVANPALMEELVDYRLLELEPKQLKDLESNNFSDLTLTLPTLTEEVIELDMIKTNIFADNFQVMVSSSTSPIEVETGSYYRGVIKNDPGSLASFSFQNGEVSGVFSSPKYGSWTLGKIKQQLSTEQYVLFREVDKIEQQDFECGTVETNTGYSTQELAPIHTAEVVDKCTNIYFEVDYDIYQDKGGAAQAANYISSIFNEVATLYANEDLTIKISEIFVWDRRSPYSGSNSSVLLDQFQRNRTSFNGDLAQLVSYQASGGIAVLDGLCHPFNSAKMSFSSIGSSFRAVPDFSFTVMVVAHELGHLFGSHHTHACVWNGNNSAIDGCAGFTEGGCRNPGLPSQGGTIMSYCHLQRTGINLSLGFGLQPGNVIRNNVAAASCLQVCNTPPPGDNPDPDPDPDPQPSDDGPCDDNAVELRLVLDDFAMETSWKIKDNNGTVVYEGGPYKKGSKGALLLDTFCLKDGCYNFEIIDTYGDGICCQFGNGSYTLSSLDGGILLNGGQFGFSNVEEFCLNGTPGGNSCLAIDFNNVEIIRYGGLQDQGNVEVLESGTVLYLENNAWKAIEINYQITPETVIEFDFGSSQQGEIHGLGFDNDLSISSEQTIKLFGIQQWGILDYDNYPGRQNWVSYKVPIGQYYTGQFEWLFFLADHDSGGQNGNSYFRNVKIYEGNGCQNLQLEESRTSKALHVMGNQALQINPNPTSNQLNINFEAEEPGVASVQIVNALGQEVTQFSWSIVQGWNTDRLNLNQYESGTYLLKVQIDQQETTTRFQVIKD